LASATKLQELLANLTEELLPDLAEDLQELLADLAEDLQELLGDLAEEPFGNLVSATKLLADMATKLLADMAAVLRSDLGLEPMLMDIDAHLGKAFASHGGGIATQAENSADWTIAEMMALPNQDPDATKKQNVVLRSMSADEQSWFNVFYSICRQDDTPTSNYNGLQSGAQDTSACNRARSTWSDVVDKTAM
jgi:hypothetical protein